MEIIYTQRFIFNIARLKKAKKNQRVDYEANVHA
jgi:hypothetical protein